jgi:hypothetical protein
MACVNKKQIIEFDSPTLSGGEGKYMHYVTFSWPLLEAALLIFNVRFFFAKNFFEKELIKTKEIAIIAKSFIHHSLCSLSYDRSVASSKASSPQGAIHLVV